jgi:DNA-binding NarL/FixJ family response regulator
MRILFLDDSPSRTVVFLKKFPDAHAVETAEAAILALKAEKYDLVSLDHDLGGEAWVDSARPDTGFEVVRWIIENKPEIGEVTIHSHNTKAGPRMAVALKDAGYKSNFFPFRKRIPEYRGM